MPGDVTFDQLYTYEETVCPDKPSVSTEYFVFGDDLFEKEDVKAVIEDASSGNQNVPEMVGDLYRQEYTISHKGAGFWAVKATYGPDLPMGAGKTSVNIDMSGGTTHIVQSRATVHSYGVNEAGTAAADPPDHEQGIGYSDNKYEGTDIPAPVMHITVTRIYAMGELDQHYTDQLDELASPAHTNAEEYRVDWKGQVKVFAAGEMAFLGYTAKDAGTDLIEITYKFDVIRNKDDVGRIGAIPFDYPTTVIPKKGWQYLWVLYREATSNGHLVKVPKAVYVESVLPAGDFNILRI